MKLMSCLNRNWIDQIIFCLNKSCIDKNNSLHEIIAVLMDKIICLDAGHILREVYNCTGRSKFLTSKKEMCLFKNF